MLCLHAKESLRKQIWPQFRIYHPNLNDKAIGWPADKEASWDLIILIYRPVQESLLAARWSCAPTCCITAMADLCWTRITSAVCERNSTKHKCKLLYTPKKQDIANISTSVRVSHTSVDAISSRPFSRASHNGGSPLSFTTDISAPLVQMASTTSGSWLLIANCNAVCPSWVLIVEIKNIQT